MKPSFKFILFFLCQSLFLNSWGQKKMALEQIQVYSSINPTAKYWQLPTDIQPILTALDTGFFSKLSLTRDTNIVTKAMYLTKQNQLGKININWATTRDYDYHAYLELYEMEPFFLSKNKLVELDGAKVDSLHSCWLITISLFNKDQTKILQKTIILGLTPVTSIGIGFINKASASSPNYIYNAIGKAMYALSPEREDIEYMDAKVPIAYTTDNYWMPYIHNQPRIIFDTSKKFISYNLHNEIQILRSPSAILNKINIKDKRSDYPYKNIVSLIKKNRINNNNEYYQVIQQLRDVKKDLDYNLEGYLEFNTEAPGGLNQLALLFLPDSVHKIYNSKDSIGYFMVKNLVEEKDKYYFPEIIYNGYDSSKQYALTDKLKTAKFPILHEKLIDGKINNTSFSIKLSADNTIKTIFINNKLSLILSGREKPTLMVLVEKAIPENLMNFLIMFSFSEIFQNPN